MLVCRIWRPLDSFLKKALQPCKAKMLVLAAEAMQMLAVLISKDMYDIKEVRTIRETPCCTHCVS
jgi:hypothetical protein